MKHDPTKQQPTRSAKLEAVLYTAAPAVVTTLAVVAVSGPKRPVGFGE